MKTGMLRTDDNSVISVDYQLLFPITGDSVISVWSRFNRNEYWRSCWTLF